MRWIMVFGVIAVATATAHADDQKCFEASATLGQPAASASGACGHLAAVVIDALTNPRRLPAPVMTDTVGNQDSSGQTSAVASGKPVAEGGGSFALAGRPGTGLQLVTSLAVNPATLVYDSANSKTYARTSRFADVSLVLPINLEPAGALESGVQFFGLRARMNFGAFWSASALRRSVDAAFKSSAAMIGAALPRIEGALSQATNPLACAQALIAQDAPAMERDCGSQIGLHQISSAVGKATSQLSRLRDEADRYYLSLEGRFDRGDLEGDGMGPKDSLFAVYASGGLGSRGAARPRLSFRARAGLVYFDSGSAGTTSMLFFAAGGFELAVSRDRNKYSLSGGLETQQHLSGDAVTDMVVGTNLRIGVSVPLAEGKQVGISLVFPLGDKGQTSISMSGDWSLLDGLR